MSDYDDKDKVKRMLAQSKEHSYFRLGLYVYSPQWGHENFCDIHLMWGTPKTHLPHLDSRDGKTLNRVGRSMRAWYSGPNSSIWSIKRKNLNRSRPEMNGTYRPANYDVDIAAGGSALALEVGNFPQTRPQTYQFTNQFHFWLFGPLLLEDRAYGSLFFELSGPFRRDMVFRPFRLRASPFDQGADKFLPSYQEAVVEVNLTAEEKETRMRQGLRTGDRWEDIVVYAYNQHVAGTALAALPHNAHRWEWRVEAYDRFVRNDKALLSKG